MLEPARLLLGDGEAGKAGNTADRGAIDGHGRSLDFSRS
jgi:hypothetical protein